MGLIEMLKSLQPLPAEDCMPQIKDAPITVCRLGLRPTDLGPKQLQWCRDNLGNFAKYESQVLASKSETEIIAKERRG